MIRDYKIEQDMFTLLPSEIVMQKDHSFCKICNYFLFVNYCGNKIYDLKSKDSYAS